MYECLRLRSRDVSAYVVDGEFSFADLEAAGAAAVPEVGGLHALGLLAFLLRYLRWLPALALLHPCCSCQLPCGCHDSSL